MKLRDKVAGIFSAARPVGSTTECGPGYHRHADKYNNRCHPVDQKHDSDNDKTHNNNPAKQGTKGEDRPDDNLRTKEDSGE